MSLYVLASHNPGKAREIKRIFAAAGMHLVTLADLGFSHFVPNEDGSTFEANAMQKAAETATFLAAAMHGADITVISDDSGLVVDALGGLPGVDSALYLGAGTPGAVRNQHILDELRDVPDQGRTARFVCVVACILPSGESFTATAQLEGRIAHAPQGDDGFGYDPIFYAPQLGRTLAELSPEEKNTISHRGQAMQLALERLISCVS